ncbi:putative transposase [Shigella flexneri K-315]|uniref:Putative transposase n=1 Tax=Shigella flexneri K-315 TaxID=766150 RepID=I6CPZ4_SHIFL|nr:putative transposase [Shigella flexneri K-315]EIQ19273.1 putative transposase [Shigella flexneri K-315]EIQ21131.1 putative transposase [Shigella flexneri K-315]EIQ21266.1 putative transposase [Shigella flexneri K-315]EIQ21439.1 putative transposase [Shigella flexneri K-315]
MCQVFGVSRSGYYNWVQHEPSDRKQSDERLKLEIKVAHIRTRNIWNPAAPDGAGREWHHRWS